MIFNTEQALDSVKFNMKLDDLVKSLKGKVSDDEKKERLKEFMEAAEPFFQKTPTEQD